MLNGSPWAVGNRSIFTPIAYLVVGNTFANCATQYLVAINIGYIVARRVAPVGFVTGRGGGAVTPNPVVTILIIRVVLLTVCQQKA